MGGILGKDFETDEEQENIISLFLIKILACWVCLLLVLLPCTLVASFDYFSSYNHQLFI